MARTLVTYQQLAEHFGVSIDTIRRWARSGRFPVYRTGPRAVRADLAEVEAALLRPVEPPAQ